MSAGNTLHPADERHEAQHRAYRRELVWYIVLATEMIVLTAVDVILRHHGW